MRYLITGGGGFLGARLARAVKAKQPAAKITLLDVAFPPGLEREFTCVEGDLSEPTVLAAALQRDTTSVFHLAAVVSGGAEADFDLGYSVNLDGTRALLEACRVLATPPKIVYASSVAAFGGQLPEVLDDSTTPTPQTSYGTQKVIGEYLLADWTRKGMADGRSLRLPTIVVRPGKPNLAASGFFSNIIREPLAGYEAVLPVGEDVRHWHASPRAATGFLIHAATMDTSLLGNRRNVTLPGVSCTVGEQIAALRKVAGEKVVARIKREPNETIMKIVSGWPRNFEAKRGRELGFKAESSFEDIIRVHIADELGGKIA